MYALIPRIYRVGEVVVVVGVGGGGGGVSRGVILFHSSPAVVLSRENIVVSAKYGR